MTPGRPAAEPPLALERLLARAGTVQASAQESVRKATRLARESEGLRARVAQARARRASPDRWGAT